jgi:hypothetical protein
MAPKAKPPQKGVVFPLGPKGDRSTGEAGKAIISAAMKVADEGAAAKCASTKNWRFGYSKQFQKMVDLQCKSPEVSIAVAKAGLDHIYSNFMYIDPRSMKEMSLQTAKDTIETPFKTGTFQGTSSSKGLKLTVPFDGPWLPTSEQDPEPSISGKALKDQVVKWAELGVIEEDAAQAINYTSDLFEKTDDLLKDNYFVMIGAGSAMGPFNKLLELGANIVALDIPGAWGDRPAAMWERLIAKAKSSPGSITFPLNAEQDSFASEADMYKGCGANLMEQPVEIAKWVAGWANTLPKKAKICIGNYTYLNGDLHVKLAIAADMVMTALREVRPDTAVAFLCTPTDYHVVTEASHLAAKTNFGWNHAGKLFEVVVNLLTMGKKLQKNAISPRKTEGGENVYLVDGISVAQGPNYALAKRIQHWRAQSVWEEGGTVSSMIAPSTATISVTQNKTFKWAYGGMPFFQPFEIFKGNTTNAVMTALLVHDMVNADGPKNPKNKAKYGIPNSIMLFRTQSVHGGLWRCAYKVDSLGECSALIHFLGGPKFFIYVFYLIIFALVFGASKLF